MSHFEHSSSHCFPVLMPESSQQNFLSSSQVCKDKFSVMKNFFMTWDKFKDSTWRSQNFPYSQVVPLSFWSHTVFWSWNITQDESLFFLHLFCNFFIWSCPLSAFSCKMMGIQTGVHQEQFLPAFMLPAMLRDLEVTIQIKVWRPETTTCFP